MIPDPPWGMGAGGGRELKWVQAGILYLKEEFKQVCSLPDLHPITPLSPKVVGAQGALLTVPGGVLTFWCLLPPLCSTAMHLIHRSLVTACPAAVHCWCWHPVWLGESLVKALGLPGYSASCQLSLYPRGYLTCHTLHPAPGPQTSLGPVDVYQLSTQPGPRSLRARVGISESHHYYLGTGDSFRELPSSPVSAWPCCTTALTLICPLHPPRCPGWHGGQLGDDLLSKAPR